MIFKLKIIIHNTKLKLGFKSKLIGFKATENLKCRGFRFEVGKTYKIEGELEMCKNGFHFCKNLKNTLHYYDPYNPNLTFVKIAAHGPVVFKTDYIWCGKVTKAATSNIEIIGKISNKKTKKVIIWGRSRL